MVGSVLTETAHSVASGDRTAATYAGVRAVGEQLAAVAAFAGVVLLALMAPFEWTAPLLRLPGQSMSNLEAAVATACAAWIAALVWSRRAPVWRTAITGPWLAFLAAMLVAALVAPTERANALHMAGRFVAAFSIYLLAVNGITTRTRLIGAMGIVLATGVAVSVLAILEYLGIPVVLAWLKAFRPHVMTVGALVRAGGPLQYPTIASMYLEIAFAVGVGLMLWSADRSRALAIGILAANLVGDSMNALVRHDPRTLIGMPIGGAMIAYLLEKARAER
jgi:hypothetical protein